MHSRFTYFFHGETFFVKFVDFDDDSDVEVDSNADAANHQEGTAPTKLPSIHH